jgi:threonyl-tRNA synthetase
MRLIGHFGGDFPAWLLPEEVCISPVNDHNGDYARDILERLRRVNVRVSIDIPRKNSAQSCGRRKWKKFLIGLSWVMGKVKIAAFPYVPAAIKPSNVHMASVFYCNR